MKKSKTYQKYLKSEDKENYMITIFGLYDYQDEELQYIKNYCNNLLNLIQKDKLNYGYDEFTQSRVNIELENMAKDILALAEGKGVCPIRGDENDV